MKKILWFLPVLLLFSCRQVVPSLTNLAGNWSYQQGDYQDAIVKYSRALKGEWPKDVLYYNLGNVFYALGEGSAALDTWSKVENSQDAEILFRVNFNKGTLYYQQGFYEESFIHFRRALLLKPESWEAKYNLELVLRKISKMETLSQNDSIHSDGENTESLNETTERLLQYIKRKESLFWSDLNVEEIDNPEDW